MSAAALERKPFVVAISGTSGAGKSTLIRRLATLFPKAVCFNFDEYVQIDNTPAAIRKWLAAGAPPAAFKTPRLSAEIRCLVEGDAGKTELVLIEDPFGRARPEMAPFIAFSAYLEMAPEIALARRLLRTLEQPLRPLDEWVPHVVDDLKTYLASGREAYAAAERAARQSADLILNGEEPVENLAATLATLVEERLRGQREC